MKSNTIFLLLVSLALHQPCAPITVEEVRKELEQNGITYPLSEEAIQEAANRLNQIERIHILEVAVSTCSALLTLGSLHTVCFAPHNTDQQTVCSWFGFLETIGIPVLGLVIYNDHKFYLNRRRNIIHNLGKQALTRDKQLQAQYEKKGAYLAGIVKAVKPQ